jgi:thiol-disulfide isomerase/thioredoxin
MRIILFAIAMLINIQTWSQAYEVSKDEKTGFTVYKGVLQASDLRNDNFKWFATGVDSYKPDAASISYLKDKLSKYKMVVFLGTWCDDSHIHIPRLFKVMQETNFPQAQLTMYGVDREKTTTNGEHKTYEIKHVPTIILLDGDKEMGRIVESTYKSMEADLAAIISKYTEQK